MYEIMLTFMCDGVCSLPTTPFIVNLPEKYTSLLACDIALPEIGNQLRLIIAQYLPMMSDIENLVISGVCTYVM